MVEFPPFFLGGNLFGYSLSAGAVRDLLSHAARGGFVGIDTASVYGLGLSEELIGAAPAFSRQRETFFLSTKVGVSHVAESKGKGRRRAMRKSLDQSLRRLRTDYVDLLSLHHPDTTTPLEESLAFAVELENAGLIRSFGLSNPVSATFRDAASQRLGAVHVFGNVVQPDLIDEAFRLKAPHTKLLVYGSLGRSILVPTTTSIASPSSRASLNNLIAQQRSQADVVRLAESIAAFAQKLAMSPAQLLVGYVRSVGAIPVVGIRTVGQFDELVGATDDLPGSFNALVSGFQEDCVSLYSSIDLGRPVRVDTLDKE